MSQSRKQKTKTFFIMPKDAYYKNGIPMEAITILAKLPLLQIIVPVHEITYCLN